MFCPSRARHLLFLCVAASLLTWGVVSKAEQSSAETPEPAKAEDNTTLILENNKDMQAAVALTQSNINKPTDTHDASASNIPADIDPLRLSDQKGPSDFYSYFQDNDSTENVRLTDRHIPWGDESLLSLPPRPSPFLEIGDPYFRSGELPEGFEMPGGAMWRPGLMAFGQYRTAVQSFNNGKKQTDEWANRLDLFFNLRLTGSERILAGFRPLDKNGKFSGWDFSKDEKEDALNANLVTIFFEGDLDQLFPNWLNPTGAEGSDISYSVGRQQTFIQEGFLINDLLDSVAIANKNIHIPGIANAHSTFLYAWDSINRNNNVQADSATLFDSSSEFDFRNSRVQVDLAYVNADRRDGGDGYFLGLSSFQRIGGLYTTLRMNNSWSALRNNAAVSTGTLLFGEFSFNPFNSDDLVYVNPFWGIDHFASAARAADAAGPLGNVGILFAAKGLGAFNAPISNRPDNSYGGAIGYQHFMNTYRTQVTAELGIREDYNTIPNQTVGAALSFEQALGRHIQLFVDFIVAKQSNVKDPEAGARTELSYKF